ncbi:hypothetical protein NE562_11620 [Butyricicoccus faecihominis]|uniref:hypothetical protein n=1 Tax=Butyricicoccus faecihominis TaxID=1712515 RepID=UPI0024789E48|nr:hypothetical protein [Butyricicoccus faecihominis]MCQ5130311.1 hypothetical protein [Butyricicoccus faecihominis]
MTNAMIRQLEVLSVERRPEACMGCGFEDQCSIRGCTVMKAAIATLRAQTEEKPPLTLDELETALGGGGNGQ